VLSGRVEAPDEVVAGLSVVVVLPGRVEAPWVVSPFFVEDPSTPVTLLGMAVVSRGVEARWCVRCA